MDKMQKMIAEAVGKKTFLLPEIGKDREGHIYLIWQTHAQRFTLTEAGLHKALKLIPFFDSLPGHVTGRSNIATKLLDARKARVSKATLARRTTAQATDAERQSALDIVRRFKVKAE